MGATLRVACRQSQAVGWRRKAPAELPRRRGMKGAGQVVRASEVIARQEAEGRRPSPPRSAGSTVIDVEERPIIEELRVLGVDTFGVHHLRDKADQHPGMREVLFKHLELNYSEYVRSRMASALGGRKIARGEFDRLVSLYRSETSERVQGQFADAVSRAGAKYLDDVIELIKDESLGRSRVLLVSALTRSRQARAKETLRSLRYDPDLEAELSHRIKD